MESKTDKKTLALIEEVKKRKKEIIKLEKPHWLTNCSFTYVEGNLTNSTNIHVESNVKNLISIAAFLIAKEDKYNEAAKLMGIDTFPSFTWGDSSVSNWLSDIKTRISKIQIASKKKKLEELETRLNKLISPEMKAELELADILKELE